MKKKTRRNYKKSNGGMINTAAKMASTVAQKAALEYSQRIGPKIVFKGIDNPENLKDPSLYITGKKSVKFKPSLNPNLIKTNNPVYFDENYNPNIMKKFSTGGKLKTKKRLIRRNIHKYSVKRSKYPKM